MSPRIKIDIVDRKTGKTEALTVEGGQASRLVGMKIGDALDGSLIGKAGHKFKITGGSDTSGFPMLSGVHGAAHKRLMLTKGKAARTARKGERLRVTVRGETISEDTAQVNLVRIEQSQEPVAKATGL